MEHCTHCKAAIASGFGVELDDKPYHVGCKREVMSVRARCAATPMENATPGFAPQPITPDEWRMIEAHRAVQAAAGVHRGAEPVAPEDLSRREPDGSTGEMARELAQFVLSDLRAELASDEDERQNVMLQWVLMLIDRRLGLLNDPDSKPTHARGDSAR